MFGVILFTDCVLISGRGDSNPFDISGKYNDYFLNVGKWGSDGEQALIGSLIALLFPPQTAGNESANSQRVATRKVEWKKEPHMVNECMNMYSICFSTKSMWTWCHCHLPVYTRVRLHPLEFISEWVCFFLPTWLSQVFLEPVALRGSSCIYRTIPLCKGNRSTRWKPV